MAEDGTDNGTGTARAMLERFGLVAPPDELPPLRVTLIRFVAARNRKWPSYAVALDGAPLDSEGNGRPQPGGFCLEHDSDYLGVRHRRDRRAAAGGKHQVAGEWQELRRTYRPQRRAGRGAPPAAAAAASDGTRAGLGDAAPPQADEESSL
jgi:hypothetical protein